MNRKIPRLLGALTLASALVTLAVAGPVTGRAANLQFSVDNLSPTVVSQGALGGFHITASNPADSNSNISQLYLTEKSGAGVYAIVNSREGTCTTSGQLLCSFGALRPGESIDVRVALTAPGSGANWDADFEFSSTGYVIGKNKSHGDLFTQIYHIALASPNDNSAGTYVWDAAQETFHDGLTLGANNKQSTTVTVFEAGFPASAADALTISCIENSTICPSSFFGEASEISVDSGANHLIHVVIQMYRPGRKANQVNGVYHTWTDSSNVAHEELIPGPCPATPTSPCFTATDLGSKNIQLDIWLTHNGRVNGW
jgi:hypothetical protein